ncbi:MAG: amidohydrolase [Rhizobiaceae bacterium]|nr:amidohydrolase [Rhizobiaceae bacterium]
MSQAPTDSLQEIGQFAEDLTAIRRDIHQHPELGLQEDRTSQLVAHELEKLGLEVHRQVGVTGIVGVLNGTVDGKTVGLRADMDALPMQEKTNLTYASKNSGLMHACGHDAHTTMLLGAARYLAARKNECGKVIFIFQPAEEGLGGARAMIADGLFDRFPCDEIYAIHNDPSGVLGEVKVNTGTAYAGADFFDVRITGTGAHGAYPHEGSDVIAAASALQDGFNTIVSRSVAAHQQVVLSVTKISSGTAYNVMPDEAELGGTTRFLSEDVGAELRNKMRAMGEGVARMYGVEVVITFDQVFGVLKNDANCADVVHTIANQLVGQERSHKITRADMGSEDFADMLKIVPGAYFTLGHGETVPLHNPGFLIDDAMLPIGAAFYSEIALKRSQC